LVSAAGIAGCGSGPGEAVVSQEKKERAAAIAKDDAADEAGGKKMGKKVNAGGKSIKGRLGGDQGPD
jgi:hypothetical protein